MSRADNPCHGECPERSPTCHSTCTRGYIEYAKQQREISDARKKRSVWTRAKLDAHRAEIERKKKYVMGYFK